MSRTTTGVAALLLALGLGSCAGTNELRTEENRKYNEAQQRIAGLERELDQLESRNQALAQERDAERNRADGLDQQRADLAGKLEEANASLVETKTNNGLEVKTLASGDVVLTLDSTVTFATGSHQVTAEGSRLLRGPVMEEIHRYPSYLVSLEGHTDDQPHSATSKYKTNLNLSIARANAVCEFLRGKNLVPQKRMRVVGYGEHQPVVPNRDERARAKNRRVEIVLLKPK